MGVAYIVGPSPTGAWVGQTGKIAVWQGSAWVFYTAQEGWTAYDQNLNLDYYYNGGWLGKTAGYSEVRVLEALGTASPTVLGSGNGTAASATTAPVQTGIHAVDPLTVQVQADYVGQRFELQYIAWTASAQASQTGGGGVASSIGAAIGLYVDSEASARDWYIGVGGSAASGSISFSAVPGSQGNSFTFTFVLADTSSHTISIVINAFRAGGSANFTSFGNATFTRRRIILRKLA